MSLLTSFLKSPKGRSVGIACAAAGVALAGQVAQIYLDDSQAPPASPMAEFLDRLVENRVELVDRVFLCEGASNTMAESIERIVKLASDESRPAGERLEAIRLDAGTAFEEIRRRAVVPMTDEEMTEQRAREIAAMGDMSEGEKVKNVAQSIAEWTIMANECASRTAQSVQLVADTVAKFRSGGDFASLPDVVRDLEKAPVVLALAEGP